MLSGNSLRQTVHTHCASVHQAAKLIAALLRVAGVTAGLVESNGSLPAGLWLTSPAGWLPRTGISSGNYAQLRSVIEYGLPLPYFTTTTITTTTTTTITTRYASHVFPYVCLRLKHFTEKSTKKSAGAWLFIGRVYIPISSYATGRSLLLLLS